MWENIIRINEIREIRVKSNVYLGVGAIKKMYDIAKELKNRGISKVIVVTGQGAYIKTGAWSYVVEALKESGIQYELYNKVMPNPTVQQVDEAVKLGMRIGAEAVIGIGGGSPIDAAKSVAILLEYPDKNARDLYELKFTPSKAAPIVAINLTHGTGTEANRFAVVSILEKEYKPAIAYDVIYPLYSIDDPQLMTKLPPNQTTYVSVDAINHVIEASTTKVTNPFSIMLAKETVRLVAKYLPQALANPEDLTARYYLTYASMIAGVCFDNGLLHFTHALEHPLSAIRPDLSHGLGLSIILPAVVKQIYPATAEILADVLSPIVPSLQGNATEAEAVSKGIEKWLASVGIDSKLSDLGFKKDDVPKLTDLAFNTPSLDLLLSMAPIVADRHTVEVIYTDSL
ncbi:iron-containing alcohol dehydrogenase [Desulfitobacterium sp.]|uniref:iron-containing alcohol dehydrogenase n=1 Tax=Desulfitobacterium sp. TaxID=49981 RepID=UPI002BE9BEBE|nr:iron-containing alcohol dehydrogenase [Desulfitobacterium sp.]HVJ50017.1 iron-containing alcohol dehydrogenase [Desulfitobacterium sp.]